MAVNVNYNVICVDCNDMLLEICELALYDHLAANELLLSLYVYV